MIPIKNLMQTAEYNIHIQFLHDSQISLEYQLTLVAVTIVNLDVWLLLAHIVSTISYTVKIS